MSAFEQNLLRMMQNPPPTVQQFAFQFSTNYETNMALTAIPTPITAGRRPLLEQAIAAGFVAPNLPPTAIAALIQGLTAFWIGVPVLAGVVTAFLGGPALLSCLVANLMNPKVASGPAATRIAQCLRTATQQVQYVIPPAPPQFLVVPP